MTSNKVFRCIRSKNSLVYCDKDTNTARCRLSKSVFEELCVCVGWVVHLEVICEGVVEEGKRMEVLCTAWPSYGSLSDKDNVVYLDDSVVKGEAFDWTEGTCKVVSIHRPNPCSTVRCSLSLGRCDIDDIQMVNSAFTGYPVSNGFKVSSCANTLIKSFVKSFTVQGLPYKSYGVIDVMTTLLPVIAENLDMPNQLNAKTPRASPTGVVHTLIRNCIFPSVILPSVPIYTSGVLLSGPPGVGKTYAITAVKEICKEICELNIHNLCIPDILADADPVALVKKTLNSCVVVPNLPLSDKKALTTPAKATPARKIVSTPNTTPTSQKSMSNFEGDMSSPPGSGFSWLTPSPQRSGHRTATPATPLSSSATLNSVSKASLPSNCTSPSMPVVHIVMLDEVDALGSGGSPDATNDLQHAIKKLICNWMDSEAVKRFQLTTFHFFPTVVIATTNMRSDVDPCFCRGGRLEKEIDISESSVADREKILRELLQSSLPAILGIDQSSFNKHGVGKSGLVDFVTSLSEDLALMTGGYVAADLSMLLSEIILSCSLPEALSDGKNLPILMSIYDEVKAVVISAAHSAKKRVLPSCLRGISIELPNLTMNDVIGYPEVKKNLSRVLSFSNASCREKLIKFGQGTQLGGVLLYGPPGNSKTRLVQAAAAVNGLPVISLSSADVYSAYVGDSEAEIRRVFNLARQSHPCVLFMDEIDALVTNRQGESSSSNVESRVLSTLLNEMDGIGGSRNGVFVIAATNRIESIDSALLRKGRFHHLLHVPFPSMEEKEQLLRYFGGRFGLDIDNMNKIAPMLNRENLSGADIENFCREEGMSKIRAIVNDKVRNCMDKPSDVS